MTAQTLEDIRKRAANHIKHVCSQYGLYGNVVYYEPSSITTGDDSNRNRLYIVAGLSPKLGEDPPPFELNLDYIARQCQRNEKLFYPRIWALDFTSDVSMVDAMDQLVEYIKRAGFISDLYGQYGLPVPQKLRLSEVNHLIDYQDKIDSCRDNPELVHKYQEQMTRFFKMESRTGSFHCKWMDYYRSDKFPEDGGAIAKLRGYFRRSNPEISVSQLMETGGEVKKLQMQEFEYKLFRQYMKDCFPEVSFAPGKRELVNHGLTPPADRDKVDIKQVTWEEYCVVRKERFAKEGYSALADLKPSCWDFRDVHYRAIDEPMVAAAYNDITLQYAKCNSLSDLKRRGEIRLERVPLSNFMNFVSLAKTNGLRFYLDNRGDFAFPSLDTIHVIYNESQQELMSAILERIIHDKVNYSHITDLPHPPLQNVIEDIALQPNRSVGPPVQHTFHQERP